ncbi:hypothetical protein CZ771_06275 [Actinomycetales bacterium JB111]|nr:hypothetical protein CZ771_06275 [Actinomycetales bacterium JB111]
MPALYDLTWSALVLLVVLGLIYAVVRIVRYFRSLREDVTQIRRELEQTNAEADGPLPR